jgi:hypothetical protein
MPRPSFPDEYAFTIPVADGEAPKPDPQASAGSLLRLFPKEPLYPPPALFKTPKYSKVVVIPAALKILKDKAMKKAIEAVQNTKSAINDLSYIYPNPYERFINEAANRHISRDKQ